MGSSGVHGGGDQHVGKIFSSPEMVIQLKPEELAIPLLRCLIHLEQAGQDNNLVRENFFGIVGTQ